MTHPFTRLRDALGISQALLGESLGCLQSRISQIEAGSPCSARLALVAMEQYGAELGQLGVSLEDILRPKASARIQKRKRACRK